MSLEPRRHTLPIKNSWAKAGEHSLIFYDWGDVDSTTTTICVHGLTRNAHDFDVIAPRLAATGRRVFTINMAGRGESSWLADPMGYNYGSYAADCLAIMDNFHLRKVEWLGTSMGGVIGMTIAAHHPDRIKKLILNDIGSQLSAAALKRIYDYVQTMPSHFETRADADAYLGLAFKPFGITDPAQWQKFVDGSLIPNDNGTFRYACDPTIAEPLRFATQNFTEINDVNLTALWEMVSAPTLILHGAESDVLSADTVALMRKTNGRAESRTIEGVGHAPALMDDAQINLVINWLNTDTSTLLASAF